MIAKAIRSRAWVVVWLAIAAPLAAQTGNSDGVVDASPGAAPAAPADAPVPAITGAVALPAGSVCSPWTGPGGGGCCGPVGGNGPILREYFIRSGVNFITNGGILKETLQTGYVQSFGARSLFFNVPGSSAWSAEFGIDYFFNNGGKSTFEYPIDVINTTTLFANIREYHRAAFHAAFGRESYLYSPGYNADRNCRVGWDVGGRYGYSRLNLNVFPEDFEADGAVIEFNRRSDTFATFFVSLHADAEFPVFVCKSFVVGIRAEYGYNFTDIVQLFDSDTQEVNIMMNFGLKY